MSSDEKHNRSLERRRELNRQAAQKLRNRQKEKAVNIKQEYFAAQSKNTQLTYEHKQLKKYRDSLQEKLGGHLPICQKSCVPSTTSYAPQSIDLSSPVDFSALFSKTILLCTSGSNNISARDLQLVPLISSVANAGSETILSIGKNHELSNDTVSDKTSEMSNGQRVVNIEPEVNPEETANGMSNDVDGRQKLSAEGHQETEANISDSDGDNLPSDKCSTRNTLSQSPSASPDADGTEDSPKPASVSKRPARVKNVSSRKRNNTKRQRRTSKTLTEHCLPLTVSAFSADD